VSTGTPAPVSRWVDLGDPLLGPMLDELTAEYLALYGPGAHEEMARHPAEVFTPPGGGVLALVADGVAVAAGAFRPRGAPALGRRDPQTDPPTTDDDDTGPAAAHGGEVAEIKRMWTSAAHRRRGLARRVLAELEDAAAHAGYSSMYLSTGWRQGGAVRLYLAAGYHPLFDVDGDPAVPFERGFSKPLTIDDRSAQAPSPG
jgi:GNAT superfamily N-acetyltransferase